jgi:hypothetical protein
MARASSIVGSCGSCDGIASRVGIYAEKVIMRRRVAFTASTTVVRMVFAPSLVMVLVSMTLMRTMTILTLTFDLVLVLPKALTSPYSSGVPTSKVWDGEVHSAPTVRITNLSEQSRIQ